MAAIITGGGPQMYPKVCTAPAPRQERPPGVSSEEGAPKGLYGGGYKSGCW